MHFPFDSTAATESYFPVFLPESALFCVQLWNVSGNTVNCENLVSLILFSLSLPSFHIQLKLLLGVRITQSRGVTSPQQSPRQEGRGLTALKLSVCAIKMKLELITLLYNKCKHIQVQSNRYPPKDVFGFFNVPFLCHFQDFCNREVFRCTLGCSYDIFACGAETFIKRCHCTSEPLSA